jgi:tripartite-type tricarboxylate transporter receptor subunit TctC
VKVPRRQFLHLAAGAAALPAASRIARAQTYPTRPVRIIVPFAPGGGLDFVARVIGEYLTRGIGQQVIVENKSGGAGMIGTETAAKSPPDGYTVLVTTDAISSVPHVVKFNTDYVTGLLAQSSEVRSPSLPELPTFLEAGVKGLTLDLWQGVFVPTGTPAAIIARLNTEMGKALADGAIRDKLLEAVQEPVGGSPGQFASLVRKDSETYARLAKELNIKAD